MHATNTKSGITPARATPLAQRVFAFFWLKCIGSAVVIAIFFVAYFFVLNHPFFSVIEMPLLAVDRWMPVMPFSAWVYFSLWVYIYLPSSLMTTRQGLGFYLMGALLLSVCGLSIFYAWPTAVPLLEIDWSLYPMLLFLKESDAAGNACPSLHVGFAVYAGLWLARMLRLLGVSWQWFAGNALWCGLIVLSTMTTKQHVFIDVLCGGALGWIVFWLNDAIARKARFAAFDIFRSNLEL